jgi:hypothetical protein
MRSKFNYLFILFAVFACVSIAGAAESSNHKATSGNFGVAWLDEDGIVHVYDNRTVFKPNANVNEPIPNVKIYMIAAADLLEEGNDQLIYLDDAKKSLYLYSFTTKKILGPFGSNIKTFAVGQWSEKESFPSLFASTFSGQAFRWTKEIMDKSWIPVSGNFEQVTPVKSDGRGKANDFVVITDGNIYSFSTQWQTYSQLVMGKGAVGLIAGNFTTSSGDEIIFWDKSGSAFLLQNQTVENLEQKVTCAAIGTNYGDLSSIYFLDENGKLLNYKYGKITRIACGIDGCNYSYERESKPCNEIHLHNALIQHDITCSDLVMRSVRHSDGGLGHYLYAVSKSNLYHVACVAYRGEMQQLSYLKAKILLGDRGRGYKGTYAEYCFNDVPFKPYIDVLRTPSGVNILRDAPSDHLHHHGLMFALAVNGCNFWEENTPKNGKQITVSINPDNNRVPDRFESELEWRDSESNILIKEFRKISAGRWGDHMSLYWNTELKALDKGVILDESNHHYFGLGMRFDQTMDKDGRFFSDFDSNKFEVVRGDERLTNCRWMAYTAKLQGKPVTVALYDFPSNPVPMLAFTMGGSGKGFAYLGASLNLHRKPIEMKPNTSLNFNYLIQVWDGEVTPEIIEKTSPMKGYKPRK